MSGWDLQARERSALYWLLAELFMTCPDAALVERLRSNLNNGDDTVGASAASWKALAGALPSDAGGIELLAVEYTRLFGAVRADYGPKPPYESMHRKIAEDQVTTTVEAFYIKAGLAASGPAAPPDHLGVELRFMALLCHEEAECRHSRDISGAERAQATQTSFLDCHLLTWVPDYLAMIQSEARVPFYSELSRLTLNLLDDAGLSPAESKDAKDAAMN